MTVNERINGGKVQHNLNGEAAKISAVWSNKLYKH